MLGVVYLLILTTLRWSF